MKSKKQRVTLALERYDRHIPFFTNSLDIPSSIELVPLEVGMAPPRRDGVDRHRRMLRDHEFDASELSLSSYIIAKSRGAPFTAIPVFPRRLFSQNHIFVGSRSGIRQPQDLIGKRMAISSFQVTLSVLAKGDLETEYGVPWEKLDWITLTDEETPWDHSDLPIRRAPPGANLIEMIRSGEADGFILPRPPVGTSLFEKGIERLFPDPFAECVTYYRRRGCFPIMHLIALKEEAVSLEPKLPVILMRLWNEAKAQAEDFYRDPGYSLIALGANSYEDHRKAFGEESWPSGIKANQKNLEFFMDYMVDQKLIAKPLAIKDLFAASVQDT